MGLFGNLFEKKNCSICGSEIGLLGNRKLSDGNMCKECANKLSPWFSDRKESTVAQINEQLAYREANKNEVANFNVSRTLGQGTKVLLDENQRKFIVTSASKWRDANPDVIDYAQVTGCTIDVSENKKELKKDGKDNTKISYNPPQYEYFYEVYVTIYLNNPYFDEIRFRVNRATIHITNPFVSSLNTSQPATKPVSNQARQMGSVGGGHSRLGAVANAASQPVMRTFVANPEDNIDYREALEAANEIKTALTEVRLQAREEEKAAAAPKQKVTCPWCGATTLPDANGCCEYCGGSLND